MENLELIPKEQALVRELFAPDAKDVIVSDKIDNDSLWKYLQAGARAVSVYEQIATRLKPIIGRMLLIAQQRPDFYHRKGYTTFEEFLTTEIADKLGVSRAFLYEAKRLAEKWGSLPVAEFEEIGSRKLALISRWTDETKPNHGKFLKEAKKRTLIELRVWAEEQNLISKGESQPGVIIIQTSREIADEWKIFVRDPTMQQGAGTDVEGEMLRGLMAEGRSTWAAEVAEKAR